MICVSLAEKTLQENLAALQSIELAEIRLDKMEIDKEGIHSLFSQPIRLIATFRPGVADEDKRKSGLLAAISAGAYMVDIEVDAAVSYKEEIITRAKEKGCRVMLSYHNFSKTPDRAELEHILNWCFESGAHVAKIACAVQDLHESARLLGLLDDPRPLVIVGMGEAGWITRIAAPWLGSLFTYASLSSGKETAPGQLEVNSLKALFADMKNV